MPGRHAFAPDGTRLYYEVAGGEPDGPAVLLVMGLGFPGELWVETRDRLVGAGFRTITMDNRGMGRSDVPRQPFTTATMAHDAVIVLAAASVPRAHVVGTSLGGMIAQQLALRHPARVDRLVLQSTTAGLPRVDFLSATGLVRAAGMLRARLSDRTVDERARSALRLLTTRRYADTTALDDPRLLIYLEALQADVSPDGWLAQVRAASKHRAWRQLASIRAPTLVQHGVKDRVVRAAAGRAMAARIPGARLELYDRAGHLLVLERPDSIDGVARFLRTPG
jgi:pimeloyl-ACP methyl ester carboxylesterase